jgi:hypothetical protein
MAIVIGPTAIQQITNARKDMSTLLTELNLAQQRGSVPTALYQVLSRFITFTNLLGMGLETLLADLRRTVLLDPLNPTR